MKNTRECSKHCGITDNQLRTHPIVINDVIEESQHSSEKSDDEMEKREHNTICFGENNNNDSSTVKKDIRRSRQSIGVCKTAENDGLNIIIQTKYGVQLELNNVPKSSYVGDIFVIILRDTKMRHGSFEIYHEIGMIQPLKHISELVNDEGYVSLWLELTNPETDVPKLRLGSRQVTMKSGLTFNIKCVKKFVGDEPIGHFSVLEVVNKKAMTTNQINVSWLPPSHHKPFLGGYRNKITHEHYLNASAQTRTLISYLGKQLKNMYSRDAQTYKMRHFGQSTLNEMATQFSKPGYVVPNYNDKLRTPGKYETADEYLARVLREIIVIQKYTRRWLAKRRVEHLRRLRDAFLQAQKDQEARLQAQKQAITASDLKRQLHPNSFKDFDRVFHVLEQWRKCELEKILAQNLTPAERKAALALLLNQEAEMIAGISQKQVCLTKDNREKRQATLLAKAAAPLRWTSSINSQPLTMETGDTFRGRELLDLFESLRMDIISPEERLDLLISLKREVVPRQQEYKVCKEIIELINREAELIVCGVSQQQLSALRRRILNRFVVYAKLPKVNPEVTKYLRVPTGKSDEIREKLHGDMHYCLSCDRYLNTAAFPLSARATWLTPCKSCRRIDNWARKRADVEPYKRILKQLRTSENELVERGKQQANADAIETELIHLERGERPPPTTNLDTDGTDFRVLNSNPFPFLINEADVQFLVDDIWERRSVISGWLDVNDLVLVRWQSKEPWSPWNTILVTREEAVAHAKLGKFSLEDSYADAMLKTVTQRLVMGRNSFPRLQRNAFYMAYQQVRTTKRMQTREESKEWLEERRQLLPPLQEHRILTSEECHKPVYQPPLYQWPAVRGEKRWREQDEPTE